MVRNLDNIRRFFEQGVIGVRRLGSAALDMCYVACGRADAYWEHDIGPWDFAAAHVILREAGGTITDLSGDALRIERNYVVATNTRIHESIRAELSAGQALGES
jgi:myo-inositol-1(or 4)-monophosphatase